ncbi:hypothetical protein MSG28_012531 [Choristoneura fumiferana]|uniref:Uncharacterized protein n=1 Tax=Choristoneura fumiferana TaxID=7141 RepID=A0ACC0KDB6_CHOFU|nr:hypothetical protein MSG28_012531 [Choristoneura fumiferana]
MQRLMRRRRSRTLLLAYMVAPQDVDEALHLEIQAITHTLTHTHTERAPPRDAAPHAAAALAHAAAAGDMVAPQDVDEALHLEIQAITHTLTHTHTPEECGKWGGVERLVIYNERQSEDDDPAHALSGKMGDSSSGTNIRAECMEMVSGPKKRAVDGADDIGKEAPASKTTAAMRGRATSSVGAYAGMAAARAKLAKEDDDFRSPGEKNKAYVLEFPALRPVTRSRSQGGRSNDKTKDRSPLREEELVTISDLSDDSCDDPRRQYRRERIEATNPPLPRPTTEEGTLTHEETDVVECARKAAHTVLAEAAKSSNLNGVVRGNINAACREIIEAMEYLENRRESDELRKLKADNKRMREQLALLTSETKALRTAFTERNSTSQQQEASQVERRKTKAGKRSASQPEPVQTANTPNQPKAQTKNQKAQPQAQAKAQAKAQHPKAQPKVQLRAVQSIEAQPSTSMTQPATTTQFTWTEVVKKKSKAKEAKKSLQAEQNTNAKKKPTVIKKLTVPKSAAVMITMKPDTDMTYLAAMQKMTSSLKLADIGIESVKVRKSATGARLIEVPGASSARAADDLAERITKVIGDVATVQRPVKTADLRITGFDESVTPEDIKTAIVLKGGCSTENVKVLRVGNKVASTGLNAPKSGRKPQPQPTAGTSRRGDPSSQQEPADREKAAAHQRHKPLLKSKPTPTPPKKPQPRAIKITAPRTAVVVLTLREGAQTTYAALLAKARASIKLADIGLESVKVKTTMTGSRLMEMTGEEPEKLADRLADKLRSAIGDQAEITRPTKTADLRISGLDETVTQEEVAAAIAARGGCTPSKSKLGQ